MWLVISIGEARTDRTRDAVIDSTAFNFALASASVPANYGWVAVMAKGGAREPSTGGLDGTARAKSLEPSPSQSPCPAVIEVEIQGPYFRDGALARPHAGRNANGNRIGRHISNHHGIRSYHDVIADLDRPENFRPGTNVHAVADNRSAPLTGTSQVDRDALANGYIVAEYRVAADDDTAEMLNPEPSAYRCFTGQVDPGENLREQLQHPIEG